MRRPDLGRGFRARLVAVGVIGALMLSALPAASVSAVSPFDAVAVSIINLPPSAVSGQSFAFQVEAVNQFGTRDTNYGGAMDLLSITSSPPCAMTLMGIIFSNGLATVSSMTCTTVGTTIIVADTADLNPDSATINITSDRVLQFGSYPSSTTPSLLSPQPTVQLRNGSGGLITSPLNQASVTLTVSPATASFTCGGSTTMQTVGGIASFSGFTLPAGTGYRLTASVAFDVTVAQITGASFDVVGRRLAFAQQPGGANAVPSQALPIQPIVAVQDSVGVTQTAQNNGTVTLAIATGPVGATLTCTGGNTRNVVAGLATFTGCLVSAQGTGYTLTATYTPTLVGELTVQPATSLAFNVNATPAQVQISLAANPVPINPGQSSTLTVQFSSGANQSIQIQLKTALAPTYQTVVTLTTDATGRATYTTLPLTFSTTYQAVFAGGGGLAASTSNAVVVGVRRTVTMSPQWSGDRSVTRGTRLTFQSKIGPLNGVAVPRGTFQIYQQINGVWTFSTSETFACDSAGNAVFSWTFSRSGLWYVRWRANSDAYNVTAFSPINRVRVP